MKHDNISQTTSDEDDIYIGSFNSSNTSNPSMGHPTICYSRTELTDDEYNESNSGHSYLYESGHSFLFEEYIIKQGFMMKVFREENQTWTKIYCKLTDDGIYTVQNVVVDVSVLIRYLEASCRPT
eukprot:418173_1